jgi:Leucine-rich repeat (LRR) protein
MSANRLRALPTRSFAALQMLAAADNLIEEIPPSLLTSALGALYLSANRLTSVPRAIGGVALGSLDLSSNKIAALPDELFANCSQLQVCDLR